MIGTLRQHMHIGTYPQVIHSPVDLLPGNMILAMCLVDCSCTNKGTTTERVYMRTYFIHQEFFGGSAQEVLDSAVKRIQDAWSQQSTKHLPVMDTVDVKNWDLKSFGEELPEGDEYTLDYTVSVPDSLDLGTVADFIRYNSEGHKVARVKMAWEISNEDWGLSGEKIWDAMMEEEGW